MTVPHPGPALHVGIQYDKPQKFNKHKKIDHELAPKINMFCIKKETQDYKKLCTMPKCVH